MEFSDLLPRIKDFPSLFNHSPYFKRKSFPIWHLRCITHMRFIYMYMSCCIRKPTTYIAENKGADQLCSDCTADQRLCFRFSDRTIPLFLKSTCFYDCTSPFVSDLVGNLNGWLSQDATHVYFSGCQRKAQH